MMGAFAGGMAPIFVAGANTACISTVSVAHAASCPTPTKRYQEAAQGDSEDKAADATESVSDNIFKAASWHESAGSISTRRKTHREGV